MLSKPSHALQSRAVKRDCSRNRLNKKQLYSKGRNVPALQSTRVKAAGNSGVILDSSASVLTPRSIHDVDNGKILGFSADLSEDHPGFMDQAYKSRRVFIAQLAANHKIGEPISHVQYTDDEKRVWATAFRELQNMYPKHACKEFNTALPMFNFKEEEIPQLEDVSAVLEATTGWRIRPTAGLMHPRDFLNGLAFKYFHSTQYVRHHSKPMYTPEPDIVHELLGHVPMLVDPAFSSMVQAIGQASLGADEKLIWHLTKVYWFTVEFGVVKEPSGIKAFGAGILSSFGEMEHMGQGRATLELFDPFVPQAKMSYKDGYQKRYFVLQSFEDGARMLRDYALSVQASRQQVVPASVPASLS